MALYQSACSRPSIGQMHLCDGSEHGWDMGLLGDGPSFEQGAVASVESFPFSNI